MKAPDGGAADVTRLIVVPLLDDGEGRVLREIDLNPLTRETLASAGYL